MHVGREKLWQIWLLSLLALLSLVFLLPRGFNLFDEGLIVVDAMRILRGEVPHRDFYANYGPGQYAAVALLFSLFGQNLLVAKLYGLAIQGGILVALLFAVRGRLSRTMGLAVFASVYCWMLALPEVLYPIFPCILLAIIGGNLLVSAVPTRFGISSVVLAGMLTGVVALFRYETGAFLMLAHIAAISCFRLVEGTDRFAPWRADAFKYCLGVSIIFLPFAICFLAVAGPSGFVHDILQYPSKYYGVMRALPFPDLAAIRTDPSTIGVYVPLFAVIGACACVGRGGEPYRPLSEYLRRASAPTPEAVRLMIVFALTGGAFFAKGVVRVSTLHMLMAIVPAQLAIATIVQSTWRQGSYRKIFGALLAFLAFLPPLVGAYRQLQQDRYHPQSTLGGWWLTPNKSRTDVSCSPPPAVRFNKIRDDYTAISLYVARATKPGEPIFVGLARHDRIFVNSIGVYFIADRPPATHWHQFDPGLQTRADIQQAMVAELTSKRTRWLIIDNGLDSVREPNGSALSSGVRVLDDFIGRNYRPIESVGRLQAWLINSETADPVWRQRLNCAMTERAAPPHN